MAIIFQSVFDQSFWSFEEIWVRKISIANLSRAKILHRISDDVGLFHFFYFEEICVWFWWNRIFFIFYWFWRFRCSESIDTASLELVFDIFLVKRVNLGNNVFIWGRDDPFYFKKNCHSTQFVTSKFSLGEIFLGFA